MTDRCSGATSRSQTHSPAENACRPTDEQSEAQKVGREQDAEREAEIRRNQYFADGTDEGGRSARASSDARSYSPMLPDDPKLKDSRRTAAIDRPLQDDKYGNAIVGAVGAGVVAGVRIAVAESLAPGAAAGQVARSVGENVVDVGKTAAKDAVTGAIARKVADATAPSAPDVPAGPPPAAAPPPAPAGQSNANGTSSVAPEPNQSVRPSCTPLVIRG